MMTMRRTQYMTLSEYVEQARQRRGLSLRELESKSGVSKGAIEAILNGKTKNPEITTLTLLAEALEVPVTELMRHAGMEVPNVTDTPIATQIAELATVDPELGAELLELARAHPELIREALAWVRYRQDVAGGRGKPDQPDAGSSQGAGGGKVS